MTETSSVARPLPPGEWQAEGLQHLGACPVCGASSRAMLHPALRDVIFFSAPGTWTMWRCDGCANGYLDPRPTAQSIHLAYTRYYTHEDPAPRARDLKFWDRIRRSLANGYRNWRYGASFTPASRLGVPAVLAMPAVRQDLDLLMRYLPRPGRGSTKRVLDVGCGAGAFLDFASAAGWQVHGCDPDPVTVAKAQARGRDVRAGGIEAWHDAEGWFDAVTLNHVIEHVHDPVQTLVDAKRLLRPGGTLFVDTPNLEALGHQVFGPSWRGLEPPRHLVMFSWTGMRRVVQRVGFEDFRRRPRPGVFRGLAIQSARVAAGIDPGSRDEAGAFEPDLELCRRAERSPESSEFITFTCRKPGPRQ